MSSNEHPVHSKGKWSQRALKLNGTPATT